MWSTRHLPQSYLDLQARQELLAQQVSFLFPSQFLSEDLLDLLEPQAQRVMMDLLEKAQQLSLRHKLSISKSWDWLDCDDRNPTNWHARINTQSPSV